MAAAHAQEVYQRDEWQEEEIAIFPVDERDQDEHVKQPRN